MSISRAFWIIVLVGAYLGGKAMLRDSIHATTPPLQRPAGEARDPCAQKRKCVVYYMAPWCPVCEATLPTALAISKIWTDAPVASVNGLRILVGNDKPAKSEALAKKIGWLASTDAGDKFSRQYQVTSFPTWIVFDAKGLEVLRVSAGIRPEQAQLFIQQGLKL